MKKFNFSLEKLMEFKEQTLKNEKNKLAQLNVQKQELVDKKKQTINLFELKNNELRNPKDYLSIIQIKAFKQYLTALSENINQLTIQIDNVTSNIEKQLSVVVSCTQELNSMDKLKEKQLDAYKKAENKENENFIEEFVTNSSARKI